MERAVYTTRWNRTMGFLTGGVPVIILVAVMLSVSLAVGERTPPRSAAITAEEIDAHIRFLASDALAGRQPGTEGAEKAADYIASEFRAYGLRPLGEQNSFRQSFSFVSGIRLGPDNALTLMRGSQEVAFRPGRDFMPLAFSRDGSVEADVVFAGFGISAPDLGYDDYAGSDVSGKIVLLLTGSPEGDDPHGRFGRYLSPRYKTVAARDKGARGVLFIASEEDLSKEPLARLRYDHTFGDSGVLAFVISQRVAEEMLRTAGRDLTDVVHQMSTRKAPHSFALSSLRLRCRSDVIKERKTTANVVALLPGADPTFRGEYIIVGAHYDHLGRGGEDSLAPMQTGQIHNGADDNASGVAGLLELAQALAAERRRLKRSVLFVAFSAEEEGLLGSRHFVEHPPVPLERVIAMINLDMIGRMKDNTLIVYGLGTSPVWKPLLERLNQAARFQFSGRDDGVGPSDHTSFYLKDIPVLHFFTGVHEDYHKPSDDAEKINAEGERRIVTLVRDIVKELQQQPERPLFTKTRSPEPDRTQMGFRVSIGTIPDYGAEVEGVRLAGVRPGSPAEKAGLRAGDIIVRVGPRDVKNVYDYTYALQGLRPGQEVEFIILRGSERLTVRVIAERR
ncbi:MAG TPA: M20/M25/M40 family metallo-hydrolase [Blastocatellia bacterium]|nr:M20/M25/M40 family metallo-hydrolase [Blastocatellia bacterium]